MSKNGNRAFLSPNIRLQQCVNYRAGLSNALLCCKNVMQRTVGERAIQRTFSITLFPVPCCPDSEFSKKCCPDCFGNFVLRTVFS